jgi:hypothetical protein
MIQYELNSDMSSTVDQQIRAIDNQKFDYSIELCLELSEKLKKPIAPVSNYNLKLKVRLSYDFIGLM